MAGDWIKWTKGLTRKSEVLRIAAALNMEPAQVAGHLMEFWEWCDNNAEVGDDGDALVTLGALQHVTVDRIVHVTGFADALLSVGWMISEKGILRLSNFGRHNGQTAKTRALGKNRVDRSRNGESVTSVTVKALPEKRSKEKSTNTPQPPQAGEKVELPFSSARFAAAWGDWRKHRTQIRKPLRPLQEQKQLEEMTALGEVEAIRRIEQSIRQGWQGLFEIKDAQGMPVAPRPVEKPAKPVPDWVVELDACRGSYSERLYAKVADPAADAFLIARIKRLPREAWEASREELQGMLGRLEGKGGGL